jgi:hypothetical protein
MRPLSNWQVSAWRRRESLRQILLLNTKAVSDMTRASYTAPLPWQQHLAACWPGHHHSVFRNKSNVKQSHYTPRRSLGGRRYSSYSFLTSALDGVSGQRKVQAAIYTRKRTPCTHWIGGWAGSGAGLHKEVRGKILFLSRGSNPDRPIVQSAIRRYTDWTTLAPFCYENTPHMENRSLFRLHTNRDMAGERCVPVPLPQKHQ